MKDMATLGIDIGGTKIAVGIVSSYGDLLHTAQVPTPALAGPDAVIAAVVRHGRRVLSWAESKDLQVETCGVGAAGVIDLSGRVTQANDNLPGWAGTDIRSALQSALALPVVVINDVKAAATGEAAFGAAVGIADAIVVTVGTGVGAAIIGHGQVLDGANGASGALGCFPVIPQATGRRCPCGELGHLEAYVSGPAIAASYAEITQPGTSLRLEEVAARAKLGDRVALDAIIHAARILGRALAQVSDLLDLEAIIVGGGVTSVGPVLLGPLEEAIAAAVKPRPRLVEFRVAKLGMAAVCIGAAQAAMVTRS